MKYKIETITPDRAQRLLNKTEALGFSNRAVRKLRVEKLAHAIIDGQWQVTHQPLAITPEGAVLDGQHRLAAIILADKEVQMLVVRDVDPGAFHVVDTGAVRTAGDTLKIAGYTDVNILSAAVRGYLAYTSIMGTTAHYGSAANLLTTTDILEFLDDPDRRHVAQGAVIEASRVAKGLTRAGLKTALAMSMMTVALNKSDMGPSTVAEFYARLTDGVELKADSPILALRRWFMQDTGYVKLIGELKRPGSCANVIKSLNDYALGRPRSVVAFKTGVEPWPAPLPVGSFLKLEEELEAREAADV